MKKILFIINAFSGLFFFTLTCSSQPSYSPEVDAKIKQVETNLTQYKFQIEGAANPTLQERMKFYKINGLSIAVIHNYKIEWAKGYGWADSAEHRPVTTETLFQAGSISKSLNAIGVLKLVQEKKLDLNADINNYLTSWKFPYDSISKGKKITTKNLLSHSAGLNRGGGLYTRGDSMPTMKQILNGEFPSLTEKVHSVFEPGIGASYSNSGITLTKVIIQDITNTPYDKYMWDNVLKPLGMNSSFFNIFPPYNKKNLLATAYSPDDKEFDGKYAICPEQAGGSLWTSPTELCKYIIEMQLSYQGKSEKALSRQMTIKMLTPYIDSSYGLGVDIIKKGETNYFEHGGGAPGAIAEYFGSFEDGNGVAVMINSDNQGIIGEVINRVASVYQWKDFYNYQPPTIKKVIEIPDSILNKYLGTYKDKDGVNVATILKKNGKYLFYTFNKYMRMNFISEKNFFNVEYGTEKSFIADAQGRITGFTRTVNGKDPVYFEKVNVINASDGILNKYIGNYKEGEQSVVIDKRNNHLYVNFGNSDTCKAHFLSDTAFFLDEVPLAIYKFSFNKNGNVDGYIKKIPSNEMKGEKIDSFTKTNTTAQEFISLGHNSILRSKFEDGIEYSRKGFLMDSVIDIDVITSLKLNLAHALLFSGNYKEAIEIYKNKMNLEKNHTKYLSSWEVMIKNDFTEFKTVGLPVDPMDKIIRELKIKPTAK